MYSPSLIVSKVNIIAALILRSAVAGPMRKLPFWCIIICRLSQQWWNFTILPLWLAIGEQCTKENAANASRIIRLFTRCDNSEPTLHS